MKLRHEDSADMTDRLKGRSSMEQVSFVDWQVLVFATGAQYRILYPALSRQPAPVEVVAHG